jgi:hypothetical protein
VLKGTLVTAVVAEIGFAGDEIAPARMRPQCLLSRSVREDRGAGHEWHKLVQVLGSRRRCHRDWVQTLSSH